MAIEEVDPTVDELAEEILDRMRKTYQGNRHLEAMKRRGVGMAEDLDNKVQFRLRHNDVPDGLYLSIVEAMRDEADEGTCRRYALSALADRLSAVE